MMTGTRIDLSLADLERGDPRARSGGRERRFRCPLDACDGATYRGPAQPLVVDMTTGAWMCHRCNSSGLLTDFRTHRPADPRALALSYGARVVAAEHRLLIEAVERYDAETATAVLVMHIRRTRVGLRQYSDIGKTAD